MHVIKVHFCSFSDVDSMFNYNSPYAYILEKNFRIFKGLKKIMGLHAL